MKYKYKKGDLVCVVENHDVCKITVPPSSSGYPVGSRTLFLALGTFKKLKGDDCIVNLLYIKDLNNANTPAIYHLKNKNKESSAIMWNKFVRPLLPKKAAKSYIKNKDWKALRVLALLKYNDLL